jgi:hypothetical protein
VTYTRIVQRQQDRQVGRVGSISIDQGREG